MDPQNPAVLQHTSVPPSLLEEVEKDPKVLTRIGRKMLLIQMDAIHRKLSDPNIGLGQRQAFAEFLAKLSDAYPKASTAVAPGSGFSVNIIMGDSKPSSVRPVVEVIDATEVTDAKVIEHTTTPAPDSAASSEEQTNE